MTDNLRIFGLNDSKSFANRVAQACGVDVRLSKSVDKRWSDGEYYGGSLENVRGCDVYVINSLYADKDQRVDEKVLASYFFVKSLMDAAADRVSLICPYYAYSRQDRKTESRAPIITRYMAELFESAGIARFLTIDVHNLSAFQNAFRLPTDNLEAKRLFADYLCGVDAAGDAVIDHLPDPLINYDGPLVVLSPDTGGVGRAKRIRNSIEKRLGRYNEIPVVHVDKSRVGGSQGEDVSGGFISGDVKGCRVIFIDDLTASGKTIRIAKEIVERNGGDFWAVCLTHMLGSVKEANLEGIPRLIVTDSIPPSLALNTDKWRPRLHVVSLVKLFAQAIKRNHENGSISDLIED